MTEMGVSALLVIAFLQGSNRFKGVSVLIFEYMFLINSKIKNSLTGIMNNIKCSFFILKSKEMNVMNQAIKLLTLSIVAFCLFHIVNAQTDARTANIFNKLEDSIAKIQAKYDSGSEEEILRDIRKSFDFISDKWLGGSKRELPEDYLNTLESDIEILLQTLEISERTERFTLLQVVKRDLQMKVRAAKKGANASENFNAAINVTVRTFKDKNEVSGYLVRCNPQIYPSNKTPLFPFNNETSPSSRSLPPGYYVLWIEDKNNQKIVTRQISIGEDELVDVEIKISLP